MLNRLSKISVAFAMASSLAVGPLSRPAAASEGSTLTTIAAAAALIGGIVLYNNYEHKKQAANSIVGYTRNGGTVYGDGRIVMQNGSTIYPNANGRYPWGQNAYYMPYSTGYDYDYRRTGIYDRTHHHGYYYSNARFAAERREDAEERREAVEERREAAEVRERRHIAERRAVRAARGHGDVHRHHE